MGVLGNHHQLCRSCTLFLTTQFDKHMPLTNSWLTFQGIILSSGADNYEGGASVFITAAEKLTTAKRVGSVEEVSAGVLFYLTPAAQYTTGTTLHVDGGWHLLGPIIDVPPHKSNKAYGSCKL